MFFDLIFFFNDTATTEIYTLSLHDALPIYFSCGRFEIFSAGIDPKGVHPLAVQVMAERGVDLSGYTSNRIEQFVDQPFDVVITVCDQAQEACPTFPLAHRVIHRAFEDRKSVV